MARGKIVRSEEGEKFWLVGDHITLKVRRAETGGAFAMGTNWVGPGGGPPPHLHRGDDEMFYVFEGELMLMQGNRTFVGGAGTAVYLKKGVPHMFKNVGTGPARFSVVSTPGNFEAFVEECGERIDRIPCEKEVTGAVIEKLRKVAPKHDIEMLLDHKVEGEAPARKEAKPLWVMGERVAIKLTSEETNGNFCVAEVVSHPGGGVPSHLHKAMDELFYVIEGEYEFVLEGEPKRVEAGGTVYVPRGVRHGFRNVGGGLGRMADFHTPGGFERFFERCGVACEDPGKRVLWLPERTEMGRVMEEVGMVMG